MCGNIVVPLALVVEGCDNDNTVYQNGDNLLLLGRRLEIG